MSCLYDFNPEASFVVVETDICNRLFYLAMLYSSISFYDFTPKGCADPAFFFSRHQFQLISIKTWEALNRNITYSINYKWSFLHILISLETEVLKAVKCIPVAKTIFPLI